MKIYNNYKEFNSAISKLAIIPEVQIYIVPNTMADKDLPKFLTKKKIDLDKAHIFWQTGPELKFGRILLNVFVEM